MQDKSSEYDKIKTFVEAGLNNHFNPMLAYVYVIINIKIRLKKLMYT